MAPLRVFGFLGQVFSVAPSRLVQQDGQVRIALLVMLALVVVVVGLLYGLQRRLIYFPDAGDVPPAADVIAGAHDVTLRTSDGLELGAWFVPPRGQDRQLAVLVAPGNGGNRVGRASLAEALADCGFGVLLMDYRGYGGNPGSPSEDGLALDAEAAVDQLAELGYPAASTIYFGESLGTGVVARLATVRPPAGVVLRSPFTGLPDVGAHHYPWLPVRLLLRDRFPVIDQVRSLDIPIVVVYGDRDSVVPPELSARVARAAPHLVHEVVLPGADHNDDVMFGSRMADVVVTLAEALRR
jgi:pimeloyl-ACP methyl ester carboxylesterase